MTFLQPGLLWGLPVILVPVIIHLLNRLRYRSVRWAAMEFVLTATNTSVNRAKLRHYLVLLCRVLALLLMILGLSRPITGGWLGTTLAGSPDTIIILLDRSASMESTIKSQQISKRQHMLNLLAEADTGNGISSHYILIENVLLTPQEIAGPTVIGDLEMASATDTAASIPAMLRAAFDYMVKNKTGQTEIWVASDLQRSNWLPGSQEWQNLTAQISALPQDVSVRLLAIDNNDISNASISLHDVYRQRSTKRSMLRLALDVESSSMEPKAMPVIVTLDGRRSQTDVSIKGSRMRYNMKQELSSGDSNSGWGEIRIPADGNPRDNSCYFVCGKELHQHGVVVSDYDDVAKYLKLAVAPFRDSEILTSEVLSSEAAEKVTKNGLSILLWQSAFPSGEVAQKIEEYVRKGGSVVFFPPADVSDNSIFGFKWQTSEIAEGGENWGVAMWDEFDGPLANTDNHISLPVADLAFKRRQNILYKETEDEIYHVFASYEDNVPFLLRHKTEKGNVYVCTSLPSRKWSNMGTGLVLVPMIQRIMRQGTMALGDRDIKECGKWRSSDEAVSFERIDSEEKSNYLWNAGVYRVGERVIALNRPTSENEPEVVARENIQQLFGDIPVQIIGRLAQRKTGNVASEMWHIFVFCALLFLLLESQLLLTRRLFSKQNMKAKVS